MATERKSAAVKAGASKDSPPEDLPVMTLEEVAKHADEKDCYVCVDGYVANVTDYLEDHPGSPEQLLEVAGEARGRAGAQEERAKLCVRRAQRLTAPRAQAWTLLRSSSTTRIARTPSAR